MGLKKLELKNDVLIWLNECSSFAQGYAGLGREQVGVRTVKPS